MTRWAAIALVACAHPRPAEVPPPTPLDLPPTLVVEAPVRGAFVDGGMLVVSGRVHDEGTARVTVDGREAAVAPDGSFVATVAAPPGLAILDIHAIDPAGHDVRDVRAALVGPFAPSDGSVRAEIGASLAPRALHALADALAASARAIDFGAAARTQNPIYDSDGCLGVRVDIASVAVGKVGLELAPAPHALVTTVTVDDLVVHLDVHYQVACLGGSATMTVRTRARATGELGATVANHAIHTSLAHPEIELDDFAVDLDHIPDRLARLVRGVVRGGVEDALRAVVVAKLPPLADATLAEVLARPPVPALLGHPIAIDLVPRAVDLGPGGVRVTADAALVVAGGTGGRFVATAPAAGGTANPASDVGVWLSPDALDQLFAGLWAAHAFDRVVPIAEAPAIAMLDTRIQSVAIELLLPPTIRATDQLELDLGELTITARDGDGAEIQRFAIAVRAPLAIAPGGSLVSQTPTILAQPLAGGLDGAAVESLARLAWPLAASTIDAALARIPIPQLPSVALRVDTVAARGGMIVLDLTLAPP